MTPFNTQISRRKENSPASLKKERGPNPDERVRMLTDDMMSAAKNNNPIKPINLSNPPHREITEALHDSFYSQNGQPGYLPITYNDVNFDPSKQKFPVCCLKLPKKWPQWGSPETKNKSLNIGTLSFRHVSYDDFVDFYLIRDRETRVLNSYEIQDLAYDRMKAVLEDPCLRGEAYISLYQTGLEPLVVGAYMAIAEQIKFRHTNQMPALFVRPVFFANKEKGEDEGSHKYWGS
jgi:hypothetical protein